MATRLLAAWALASFAMLPAAAGADDVGIAVGKKAPDFRLPDQNGKTHALSEMLKKGPVAVVFYRSADW